MREPVIKTRQSQTVMSQTTYSITGTRKPSAILPAGQARTTRFTIPCNPWDKTKNENAIKRIVFTESVADFGRYLGWQPRIQRYWLEAFEIVVPLNPENAPVPSATNSIPSPAGWTDEHVSSGSPTPHPELWDRRKFYVPAGTGEAWKTKLGASHPWSEYVTEISPP